LKSYNKPVLFRICLCFFRPAPRRDVDLTERRKGAKQLAIDSVLELALVIRAVEVSFRFRDQSVIVDLPKVAIISASASAKRAAEHDRVSNQHRQKPKASGLAVSPWASRNPS